MRQHVPHWKRARMREAEAKRAAPPIGAHEIAIIAANVGDRETDAEKAAYLDGLLARGTITKEGRAQCRRTFGL